MVQSLSNITIIITKVVINLSFEDQSHIYESGGVDLSKDVCICFVLLEAWVLDLYWQSTMCDGNQKWGWIKELYSNLFNLGVRYLFCTKRNLNLALTLLNFWVPCIRQLDWSQGDTLNILQHGSI